jgi:hypothetical protein
MESGVHCEVQKSPPLILFPIPTSPVHTTPCVPLEFILVLTSCVCLRRQSFILSTEFIINIFRNFLHVRCATCTAHHFLILLYKYYLVYNAKRFPVLLCSLSFLHILPLTWVKIFLAERPSFTLLYKRTGRIIVLYTLVLEFLDSRRED